MGWFLVLENKGADHENEPNGSAAELFPTIGKTA